MTVQCRPYLVLLPTCLRMALLQASFTSNFSRFQIHDRGFSSGMIAAGRSLHLAGPRPSTSTLVLRTVSSSHEIRAQNQLASRCFSSTPHRRLRMWKNASKRKRPRPYEPTIALDIRSRRQDASDPPSNWLDEEVNPISKFTTFDRMQTQLENELDEEVNPMSEFTMFDTMQTQLENELALIREESKSNSEYLALDNKLKRLRRQLANHLKDPDMDLELLSIPKEQEDRSFTVRPTAIGADWRKDQLLVKPQDVKEADIKESERIETFNKPHSKLGSEQNIPIRYHGKEGSSAIMPSYNKLSPHERNDKRRAARKELTAKKRFRRMERRIAKQIKNANKKEWVRLLKKALDQGLIPEIDTSNTVKSSEVEGLQIYSWVNIRDRRKQRREAENRLVEKMREQEEEEKRLADKRSYFKPREPRLHPIAERVIQVEERRLKDGSLIEGVPKDLVLRQLMAKETGRKGVMKYLRRRIATHLKKEIDELKKKHAEAANASVAHREAQEAENTLADVLARKLAMSKTKLSQNVTRQAEAEWKSWLGWRELKLSEIENIRWGGHRFTVRSHPFPAPRQPDPDRNARADTMLAALITEEDTRFPDPLADEAVRSQYKKLKGKQMKQEFLIARSWFPRKQRDRLSYRERKVDVESKADVPDSDADYVGTVLRLLDDPDSGANANTEDAVRFGNETISGITAEVKTLPEQPNILTPSPDLKIHTSSTTKQPQLRAPQSEEPESPKLANEVHTPPIQSNISTPSADLKVYTASIPQQPQPQPQPQPQAPQSSQPSTPHALSNAPFKRLELPNIPVQPIHKSYKSVKLPKGLNIFLHLRQNQRAQENEKFVKRLKQTAAQKARSLAEGRDLRMLERKRSE